MASGFSKASQVLPLSTSTTTIPYTSGCPNAISGDRHPMAITVVSARACNNMSVPSILLPAWECIVQESVASRNGFLTPERKDIDIML